MLKVLIADDHALFREGLKLVLKDHSEIALVDEAENGQQVMDKIWKNRYDVVLLDISMPGRSGLEILKQIRREDHRVPVLMLSVYPEERYAIRALKSGASGYLTKTSASDELLAAIRKISSGSKYVSQTLASELATYLGQDSDRPAHEKLSDREYEVMCRMASGHSTNQIASDLSLSSKTISTFRARILTKMQMNNTAEIIHYAIKKNLVD